MGKNVKSWTFRYSHKDNQIPDGWVYTHCLGHHGAEGYGILSKENRQKDDYYPTPPEATEALLSKVPFAAKVWEPACGDGAISKILTAAGHDVISTDLNDWGYGQTNIDFLMEPKKLADCVITNPPYKLANQFVLKCIDLNVSKFAMLLRLAFLEGKERRSVIYNTYPPCDVLVFSQRLTMIRGDHDESWYGSGKMAFAWFVWEKGFKGKPRLDWL